MKLTVQKDVFQGAILQQEFVAEFVVANQQCDACKQSYTAHTWKACVQVRQKVQHKKTFFWLEQLILKHRAHSQCLQIQEQADGLDFFFAYKNHAVKFVDFLTAVVPVRSKESERLISADFKSNTANFKYTFSVEIAPVSKDDYVVLPPKFAASLSNITMTPLVSKVSNQIELVDPMTLQVVHLPASLYWRHPFDAIASHKQLVEFVILDVRLTGAIHGKWALAEVEVVRSSDFGVNDNIFYTRTHLGHLLNAGDTALGYDLRTANMNDLTMDSLRKARVELPDVILIKKSYPERKRRRKKRIWKLGGITKEGLEHQRKGQEERTAQEYEAFLDELEENPDMRQQILMFRDETVVDEIKAGVTGSTELAPGIDENQVVASAYDVAEGEEDFPEVQLTELLDELQIEASTAVDPTIELEAEAAAHAAAAHEGPAVNDLGPTTHGGAAVLSVNNMSQEELVGMANVVIGASVEGDGAAMEMLNSAAAGSGASVDVLVASASAGDMSAVTAIAQVYVAAQNEAAAAAAAAASGAMNGGGM